jgi:hypothetical protein
MKVLLVLLFVCIQVHATFPAVDMHEEDVALMNILARRSYADAEYCRENPIHSFLEGMEKINGEKFRKKPFGNLDRAETSPIGCVYFSDQRPESIFIAFHGSHWAPDWIKDFLVFKRNASELNSNIPGKLHYGFSETIIKCYDDMLQQSQSLLERVFQETDNIYFTGHSLGGALAILAAVKTKLDVDSGMHRIKVVTFAAPKPGDEAFIRYANRSLFQKNILNFIVTGDIVPKVPPGFLGYRKIGIPIEYPMTGRLVDYLTRSPHETLDDILVHPLTRIVKTAFNIWLLGAVPTLVDVLRWVIVLFHSQSSDEYIVNIFKNFHSRYDRETGTPLENVGEWSFWNINQNTLFRKILT